MSEFRPPAALRRLALPAFLLGFAFSGFFDGILLHQILQWHHLLSAIRGDDIRFQILADGYFHAAMYVIAVIGFALLWRARSSISAAGSAGRFAAYVLIGFGVWHVIDAVGSHWILQIHRIRWDAEMPLLWDVGWLAAFGLVPLLIGWRMRRGEPPPRLREKSTLASIAVALTAAGAWAAQPPPGAAFTTIVFAPGVTPGDALAAALEAGDALVWFDGAGVVVVDGVEANDALALYARGALLVSGAGAAPGCFAWTRA